MNAEMKNAQKLTDEDLDQVVGGSHISADDIGKYKGRELEYSGAGGIQASKVRLNRVFNTAYKTPYGSYKTVQYVNVTPLDGYTDLLSVHGTKLADGSYDVPYTSETWNYLSEL